MIWPLIVISPGDRPLQVLQGLPNQTPEFFGYVSPDELVEIAPTEICRFQSSRDRRNGIRAAWLKTHKTCEETTRKINLALYYYGRRKAARAALASLKSKEQQKPFRQPSAIRRAAIYRPPESVSEG
jgi:hypothetical protein